MICVLSAHVILSSPTLLLFFSFFISLALLITLSLAPNFPETQRKMSFNKQITQHFQPNRTNPKQIIFSKEFHRQRHLE